jgi:hypothetical protein
MARGHPTLADHRSGLSRLARKQFLDIGRPDHCDGAVTHLLRKSGIEG